MAPRALPWPLLAVLLVVTGALIPTQASVDVAVFDTPVGPVSTVPLSDDAGPAPPVTSYIIGLARGAPMRRGARDVANVVAAEGGRARMVGTARYNPFMVVEGNSPEHANRLARAVATAGIRGIRYVERDEWRRIATARALPGEDLAGDLRKLQQGTVTGTLVPYGVRMVQATGFGLAQRSTTSSVDPTKKFPLCIIDSGFDASHPSLQGVDLMGGFPVGYDTDVCGHGSHVSGTISARGRPVLPLAVDGVLSGPDVDVYMIKVFNRNANGACGWALASTLTAAMQNCTAMGAKVVSMSLAGTANLTTEATQINFMYNTAKMLVFAAAGNSGKDTTLFPAAHANAISVAAVNSVGTRPLFSSSNSHVELAAPGVGVLSTVPQVVANGLGPSLTLVVGSRRYITRMGDLHWMVGTPARAFAGPIVRCSAADVCPRNTGGVCVMNRGGWMCPKLGAGLASGCSAVIVVNNEVTMTPLTALNSTNPCTTNATIPAVSLAQAEGPFLLNGMMATGTVGTAPPYQTMDGTSMATPHAAASAVLVWGMRPSCGPAEIRCALQRSALDLEVAGRDNTTGFGLVQAVAAVNRLSVVNGNCTCA